MKIWVLTRAINQYDQDGDYFETFWFAKPSILTLKSYIEGQKNDHHPHSFYEHLHNGGGRIKYEDEWYFLTELAAGNSYTHSIQLS